jgi:hypothetical protein
MINFSGARERFWSLTASWYALVEGKVLLGARGVGVV